MNPFSRRDWKKAANNPQGKGWIIGGVILILAILKVILFP